ncbi:ABC transporter ATP-binding protein [Reyranella sp.]|uniref:ABC transporter ATP-binding protein n=1 Tax=Reyranella sp. TaxID=1929291 RepID=UPI003BAA6DBA
MFITIEKVSKTYETRSGPIRALETVDLTIREKEFVSIVGPSGCGKSTLLMLLSGLVGHSTGSITIGGTKVNAPYTDIGIVFQQDVLLEWRTILQNVMLQAEVRGLDRRTLKDRALHLLELVGLKGFEGMYPHELSGGMRQRASICRALLHSPPLLLMDEPFGALDALTRDQLNIDLLRFWQESPTTVLFITHSVSEAVFLSDRVIIMSPRPGRIEEIVDIDLPRPRRMAMREQPRFIEYSRRIGRVFESIGILREE